MWRLTLRGLYHHRLRTALTCLAVAVGVALMTGTAVLVGSGNSALGSSWVRAFRGVSAAVQGFPVSSGLHGVEGLSRLPQGLVAEVAQVPGAGKVEGQVQGPIELVDHSAGGAQLSTSVTAMSMGSVPELRPADVVQGHVPLANDEMVVDKTTFDQQGWRLGRRVLVAGARSASPFDIVGVVTFGTGGAAVTTPFAGFDLPSAQALLGLRGQVNWVLATGNPALPPGKLAGLIQRRVGNSYLVVTGHTLVAEATDSNRASAPSFSLVLQIAVGAALFAGSLVVFNALSIVVAQRRRDMALLRCLGASAAQVRQIVVRESFLIGILGSVGGVAFGIAGAAGLHVSGFQAGSASAGPLQVEPWIPLLGILLGTAVTVVAALIPAARAGSTPPLAALRQDAVDRALSIPRSRNSLAAIFLAGGAAVAVLGLSGVVGGSIPLIGVIFLVSGVALAGPALVAPVALGIGWPLARLGGLPGLLGRRNAMRNARRTAATAAALVVGLALVSFLAVTSSSAKASADQQLDRTLGAKFIVTHQGAGPLANGPDQSVPLSPRIWTRLASQHKLLASPLDFVEFLYGGHGHWGGGVVPSTYPRVVNLAPVQGDFSAISQHGVAVSTGRAQAEHLRLGQRITIQFEAGHGFLVPVTFPISAIYGTGDYYSGYVFSLNQLKTILPDLSISAIFVNPRPGVSVGVAYRTLVQALHGYPNVVIQSASQAASQQNGTIQNQIDILTLLLVLAIAVAFLGIVNALVLSVFERTRELALLRALGMSARHLGGSIRSEAVIIGTLGSITGVILGVLLGWALQQSLVSQGLTSLVLPWGPLAAVVVLSALTGVLAAVVPARRAAKVDMLRALSDE